MLKSLAVTTPTETSIVMTRDFDAPRPLVFKAMTDPALLPRWLFAPPGWTMTRCEGEAVVGGRYRWEWSDEEGRPALAIHGEFRVVEPPARIVHTETMEMGGCGPLGTLLATIDLAEVAGRTRMQMTLEFDSREARDGALASGMDQGMEAGYQTLDGLWATLA